jgi:hypothetical protein
MPAAAVGFAPDLLISSEYSLPSQNASLNIRLSHVGTTLSTGSAVHPASSRGTDILGYDIAGVVEQRTVHGMSGGPVLDTSCGVLGVNHAFAQSSGYASLDEVDKFMGAPPM